MNACPEEVREISAEPNTPPDSHMTSLLKGRSHNSGPWHDDFISNEPVKHLLRSSSSRGRSYNCLCVRMRARSGGLICSACRLASFSIASILCQALEITIAVQGKSLDGMECQPLPASRCQMMEAFFAPHFVAAPPYQNLLSSVNLG